MKNLNNRKLLQLTSILLVSISVLSSNTPAVNAAPTTSSELATEGPFSELPLTPEDGMSDTEFRQAATCTGGIDYPHISGTAPAPYTINVHFDGRCRFNETPREVKCVRRPGANS